MNTFNMVPQTEGGETTSRKESDTLNRVRKLAEDKSEFQRWLRELRLEAAIMGVNHHIFKQPEEPVTRAQWGPPNNAANENLFKNHLLKIEVDTVKASELIRRLILPGSSGVAITRVDLDEGRPFNAMLALTKHFNNPDFGMLMDKTALLIKSSEEISTQGVLIETTKICHDIEEMQMTMPIEETSEEGEEVVPTTKMKFHPALIAAIALSRTTIKETRPIPHADMSAAIVKEITLRMPDAMAGDLRIKNISDCLMAQLRADHRKEIRLPVVFQTQEVERKWPARATVTKTHKANCDPNATCEIHTEARVKHLNGDCRQNPKSRNFRPKRKFEEKKNDSLMMTQMESDSDEIEEIFHASNIPKFRCRDEEKEFLHEPKSSSSSVAHLFEMTPLRRSTIEATNDSSDEETDEYSSEDGGLDEADETIRNLYFANRLTQRYTARQFETKIQEINVAPRQHEIRLETKTNQNPPEKMTLEEIMELIFDFDNSEENDVAECKENEASEIANNDASSKHYPNSTMQNKEETPMIVLWPDDEDDDDDTEMPEPITDEEETPMIVPMSDDEDEYDSDMPDLITDEDSSDNEN